MLEELWNKFGDNNHSGTKYFAGPQDILWTVGLGLLGAILYICIFTCEFYLIMGSTAVILMIGGVLKELTTIFWENQCTWCFGALLGGHVVQSFALYGKEGKGL